MFFYYIFLDINGVLNNDKSKNVYDDKYIKRFKEIYNSRNDIRVISTSIKTNNLRKYKNYKNMMKQKYNIIIYDRVNKYYINNYIKKIKEDFKYIIIDNFPLKIKNLYQIIDGIQKKDVKDIIIKISKYNKESKQLLVDENISKNGYYKQLKFTEILNYEYFADSDIELP